MGGLFAATGFATSGFQFYSKIEPYSYFKAKNFSLQVVLYIEKILRSQRVPIIVGGSNSYIEKLLEDPVFMFKYKDDSFFIWIDVEQSVLNSRIDMGVDQLVKKGLVDEMQVTPKESDVPSVSLKWTDI
uniref:Adenylate isopentenyltransferase n=1 Tax=Solanum lycopersicum TaxID=4081 RepID=A0A3Q7IUD4_SOLLC